MKQVVLKEGRDKATRSGHPWIFSGALAKSEDVSPGDLVLIKDSRGNSLGTGYANPESQIFVRILSRDPDQVIDSNFIGKRLHAAYLRRRWILKGDTNSCRIVMSETDGLPGLVVDKLGDALTVQFLTAGMERLRPIVTQQLNKLFPGLPLFDKSDMSARKKEGLGKAVWDEPADTITEISENGWRFRADLRTGQKTGFYLDQRDNRRVVFSTVKDHGLSSALDCFSYTGGFSVALQAAGIKTITAIDQSDTALGLAKVNIDLNKTPSHKAEFQTLCGDAFELLRDLRAQNHSFDCIIMDPPKFAAAKGDLNRASRAYKDVNMIAMQLLRPGGYLATFSCSGHVSPDLFQKIVFSAATDAKCDFHIERFLFQATCHPVLLSFPESLYLKGLLLKKL